MYRQARAGERTSTGESGRVHERGRAADKIGVPLTVLAIDDDFEPLRDERSDKDAQPTTIPTPPMRERQTRCRREMSFHLGFTGSYLNRAIPVVRAG